MRTLYHALAAAMLLALAGPPAWAATPEQKCEAGKNAAAGKYAACLAHARKVLVTKGDAARYDTAVAKCQQRFSRKWLALEARAGEGTCPSEEDESSVQTFVEFCIEGVTDQVAGGALPAMAVPLVTSQAICWDTGGIEIDCAGTGQDGELQMGIARSFTDNGDGTITDNATGLMWEKLSDDDGIHDKDNTYTWDEAFGKMSDLNTAAFAGYGDWRVPNVRELMTLADFWRVPLGPGHPATDPIFHTGCNGGCTVLSCSCTGTEHYWTSSTYQLNPEHAWQVYFVVGFASATGKTVAQHVRGVRGGS